MTELEKEEIREMLEEEGFDYIVSNDSFEEIGDRDFNKLVRKYVKAVEDIKAYLDMEY